MAARRWQPARLLVIGPGLVGGSIAAAARQAWPDVELTGIDRQAWGRRATGPFDRITGPALPDDPPDLTIIATPGLAATKWLARLAQAWGPDVPITDVVSTKRAVLSCAARLRLRAFIGGHPMAGGTNTGLASASATLFVGRPWLLVQGPTVSATTARRVLALVRAAGARPVRLRSAVDHDRLVASVSHVPQVLSSVLMEVAGRRAGRYGLGLSGAGLLDTTRLAGSDPALWTEILRENGDRVAPVLRQAARRLTQIAAGLDAHDLAPAGASLRAGRQWRRHLDAARRRL